MKKKALTRCSFFVLVAATTVFCYLHFFPNDFFLSKKKFVKDSSQFKYSHTFSHFSIYNKHRSNSQLAELIENPDVFFFHPSTQIIKSNHKRTVALVELDHRKFILKRYNYKNLFDWITKCPFRSSKAYRAWYYMHLLRKEGIQTATPVAIIEKRIGPVWLQTYLVAEYIEGSTLNQILNQLDKENSQLINDKILQAIHIFYANNWLHRDFVARNIIVDKDQVSIIDLDEMHSYFFKNKRFNSKFYQKHSVKPSSKSVTGSCLETSFLLVDNFPKDYNSSF